MEFLIGLIFVVGMLLFYQHKVAPAQEKEKAAYQAVAERAEQLKMHAGKLKRKCGKDYKTA
jgi:hypothetical protein